MSLSLDGKSNVGGAVAELVATGQMNAIIEAEEGGATLFKSSYTKLSPFALNQEVVQAGGRASVPCSYSQSTSHTFQVPRSADLIQRVYFKLLLPGLIKKNADGADPYYKNGVGHYAIEEIDVSFGNSRIDRLSGELMHMLLELSGKAGQKEGLDVMLGRGATDDELIAISKGARVLYTPIPFYFASGVSGLSLPIVSMQFHDVEFGVKIRAMKDCIKNADNANERAAGFTDGGDLKSESAGDIENASFMCQMETQSVYLGQSERMRFAASKQEVLICQHQHMSAQSLEKSEIELRFNHCVSELLIGVPRKDSLEFYGHKDAVSELPQDALQTISLSLNNQDRTPKDKEASFYRTVAAFQAHASIPRSHVYCMPFAQHPDQIGQPSGSLNMSRVDDVVLNIKAAPKADDRGNFALIFARSWNIVRLSMGISGLGYSY